MFYRSVLDGLLTLHEPAIVVLDLLDVETFLLLRMHPWKYFVFLSPSRSHRTLAFCLQNASSLAMQSLSFARASKTSALPLPLWLLCQLHNLLRIIDSLENVPKYGLTPSQRLPDPLQSNGHPRQRISMILREPGSCHHPFEVVVLLPEV